LGGNAVYRSGWGEKGSHPLALVIVFVGCETQPSRANAVGLQLAERWLYPFAAGKGNHIALQRTRSAVQINL
jgi:hypothetical protein